MTPTSLALTAGLLHAGATLTMAASPAHWAFHDETLENGLRVLVMEDHRTPLVSVQVWYHVGSKDEDPQRQGFAHMFEHMMFRGTDRIGPQDHFRYLNRFGARVNGYTSFDQTVYYETLPASQLDLALWLEAERLGRLKINQDYFAAEREVVKEERRKRYLNQPYGQLYETLYAAAYREHPYRWTPIGNMPHLNAATVDELRAFFELYYVPNNATLVVVGDVTHARVMELAGRYFGPLARRPDPPRVTIKEPPINGPRLVEIADRAPSPLILHAFHTPGDAHDDSPALEVLARILSSGQSSRLYRHLVQDRELAVSVNGYNAAREAAGLFVVSAVLRPESAVDAVSTALLDQVRLMATQGPFSQELEKAKSQALAEFVHGSETVQGRADQLGYAAVILGDPQRVNTSLERTRAVTAEQVSAVARKYLQDSNRVTVIVRPDPNPPGEAEQVEDLSGKKPEPLADLPRPVDLPAGKSPEPLNLPKPAEKRLGNGLRVVVFEDHAVPAVTCSLNLLTGSMHDPAGAGGLASITFNVMRRGTTKHSGEQIADILDSHAMSLSPQVSEEDTELRLWTLTEHLPKGVEILAEIVRQPTFPQREVDNLVSRSAAQQAISERDPATQANRFFGEALFGEHYLARPTSGTAASVRTITREQVEAFHKLRVAPRAACLVFSGDVNLAQAVDLAERHFGDWNGAGEPGVVPKAAAAGARQVVLVDRPEATQSEIRLGQPLKLSRADREYPIIRLVSHIFGESFNARLNRSLRIEKGLTYGASGYIETHAGGSALKISTFTRTEKTADAIRAALEVAERLRMETFTAEELADSRNSLLGSFQMGLETPSQIAARWWDLVVWGVPEDWYGGYLKAIAGIESTSLLSETARRYLDPATMSIVVVGKAADVAPQLAPFGTLTTRPAE